MANQRLGPGPQVSHHSALVLQLGVGTTLAESLSLFDQPMHNNYLVKQSVVFQAVERGETIVSLGNRFNVQL